MERRYRREEREDIGEKREIEIERGEKERERMRWGREREGEI